MSRSWLECDRCKSQFDFGPMFFGCPVCAAQEKAEPLEMKYETACADEDDAGQGLWRWRSLLPDILPEAQTSLGEGDTKLLPLELHATGAAVYLKNETTNPTWSWKDRPNAVSVSVAEHFGFGRVVAKSTGNHGNSMAAYASAAGLQSAVLCNRDTPVLQLALMAAYGATVIRGGAQDELLRDMVTRQSFFPCTILWPQLGISNPFGVEGFKTIAFEIVRDLGRVPERVFIPVGSGDGVYGIWKGFRELRESNAIEKAPRIIGCQPEGANSAAIAWRARADNIGALSAVRTGALSVAELATGSHALRAIYESGGSVMEVSEQAVLDARAELLRNGFAVELASALPYACAGQTKAEGEGEAWVLIASGAGVKWPESLIGEFRKPAEADAEVRTFEQWEELQGAQKDVLA